MSKLFDATIAEVKKLSPDDQDAAALASTRRVLPVLDGLDEMDPPGRPPHRAEAAVAALHGVVPGEVLAVRAADLVAGEAETFPERPTDELLTV